MECLDDKQLDAYFQQDATPDDAAERRELLDHTEDFNAACEKHSKRVLPHVATTDAARDMDLMRQVLGDDKLHIRMSTARLAGSTHLYPKTAWAGARLRTGGFVTRPDAEQGSVDREGASGWTLDTSAGLRVAGRGVPREQPR
ncbi:hypothetical protein [Streptomyces sp. DHE17-7]|uniref:hypothetical protein n=1 Tax=Streptomyces sp. DHE17-7 TaxID=2759949 RepID=UPI0022EB3FC7|nr:hypothetical protein [Streptomyces sp. DHE17-7]MBJ6621357.1 hypothetical protein [Streptomyces sp. DHE17-7]